VERPDPRPVCFHVFLELRCGTNGYEPLIHWSQELCGHFFGFALWNVPGS
jgi:hypothetical protein